MRRWDPRVRVLLSAVLVGGVIWLMRSQEGNMRLAIAELAAVPLAFGIWLGATGLKDLFGGSKDDDASA